MIFLISKKVEEVVVMVEGGVGFLIDSSKVDAANLGLKIGVFVTARFCFTKASFLQFFSYYFFKAFSVNRQNSSSLPKLQIPNLRLCYIYARLLLMYETTCALIEHLEKSLGYG